MYPGPYLHWGTGGVTPRDKSPIDKLPNLPFLSAIVLFFCIPGTLEELGAAA